MVFKKTLTAAAMLSIMTSVTLAPVANNKALFFAPSAISASAAKVTTYSTIKQEMEKFRGGYYWNHNPGDKNSPDTCTKNACTHHNNCNYGTGSCGCNSFGGGAQCWGFAEKVAYDIYHTYPQGSGKFDYTYSNIKAGDVVRDPNCGRQGHSFIVIEVKKDKVIVGECNYYGDCVISWTRPVDKSQLRGCKIYHAPCEAPYGSSLPKSTEPKPALGTVWVEGDTYIFKASAQMYSDKTCKTKAGTIPKDGQKVIKRFFTASNGKDTIGMIDSSHYVYVRKNNKLLVRAYVTTNYKTGVNFRSSANTSSDDNIICVIPNGKKLLVTICNGAWAQTRYNGVNGVVNLNVCKG